MSTRTPYQEENEALPFDDLPGGDLIRQGLEDLRRGVESIPALLVSSGAPRLRRLSLAVPAPDPREPLPEHRLYEYLANIHGDNAHSRYNALVRRLVSFARAAECARSDRA
jgi:hypothetical protein